MHILKLKVSPTTEEYSIQVINFTSSVFWSAVDFISFCHLLCRISTCHIITAMKIFISIVLVAGLTFVAVQASAQNGPNQVILGETSK
jgi:hypothetical protein